MEQRTLRALSRYLSKLQLESSDLAYALSRRNTTITVYNFKMDAVATEINEVSLLMAKLNETPLVLVGQLQSNGALTSVYGPYYGRRETIEARNQFSKPGEYYSTQELGR